MAKKILMTKLDAILNKPAKEYANPEQLKKKKVKHHEVRHQAKLEAMKLGKEVNEDQDLEQGDLIQKEVESFIAFEG